MTRIAAASSSSHRRCMLPLGGCASVAERSTRRDWFSGDLFNTKKKLPGDRKPVFPEGVPGVAQGIPPDLVKGNQPPPRERTTPAPRPQSVGSTPRQAAGMPRPTSTSQRRAKRQTENPSRRRRRRKANRRSPRAKPTTQPQPATRSSSRPRHGSPGAERAPSSRNNSSSRAARLAVARPAGAVAQWQLSPAGADPVAGSAARCADCVQAPRRGMKRRRSRNAAGASHELHGRHRRTAECRQVHPVQSAGRQAARAGRRPAGRHPRPPRGRGPARRSRLHGDRYRRARDGRARQPHRAHAGADRGRDRGRRRGVLRRRRARRD